MIQKEQIICRGNPILTLRFVCQTPKPSAGILNKRAINNVFVKQHSEPLFVKNFISPYIFINVTLPFANIRTPLISVAAALHSGPFKPSQRNDPVVTSMNEELNKTHRELRFILDQ